jgi:RNA polymerase sigma-70 factor (ECF subfamily)
MIRNREEAEDIVIQTLQKTFQRCKNFKTEENLKAYLYIAVRNSCLDYLKKNKIRLKDVDDCNNIPDENLVEKAELEAVKAMQMKEVYDAILTLSSSQKHILLMFWEGKSAAEIAAILNTSSANVRSQKSQALKQLGKKF